MHAQNAHFHQGYDLFSDLEPYMKQVASQVNHWTAQHWQLSILLPLLPPPFPASHWHPVMPV